MRTCVLLTVIIFLSGCSATYQEHVVKVPQSTLERGKEVFVSTPKNSSYGKTEYQNSREMTANAVKAAFSRFSNNVLASEQCLGLDCLKIIPTEGFEYYVEPEISHWQDRATEWSGKSGNIEMKIPVYNARLGTELASSVLSASSKWASLLATTIRKIYCRNLS